MRYAQAFPTRNQLAKTTAKVLSENFIVYYGFPARLHGDQGRNFESSVIKELCSLAGVQKTRTTPYHPMGNGMGERLNQTILNMLVRNISGNRSWRFLCILIMPQNSNVPDILRTFNVYICYKYGRIQ